MAPINQDYNSPVEVADAQAAAEVHKIERQDWYGELGVTGLKRAAGYIDEEFLPQLRGRKAIQVYREMGDNDPITGALLFTIAQLLRRVEWTVVPGGKSREDAQAAKLIETAKDDMSHTWDDFVMEALSCVQYGWSWHEIVYKKRGGPWNTNPKLRSKYTDGLVGWRKMPIRGQETLQRWIFDETGGVQAMVQLAPPDYKTRTLPISRSLLFRFGHHKNNPEGRSALRNSYRPWFYKKRLEEFESVGVERDLAGLPMVKVPADYIRAKPGTEQYKMVESFKRMVRSIRRNEQEGLVFPTSYDQDTKQPLFDFELLGSGGARQFSTNELIQRYENRQLMTVLADFIMVGHEGSTGTYNMHVDKTGIFRDALDGTINMLAQVVNRNAIPRLFERNGWKPANLPTFQPMHVDAPDLTQLGGFLAQTAQLGFTWGPDADMEHFLRNAAGLPKLSEDDTAKHRKMARLAESALVAETELRYLTARSELAQAMAAEQAAVAGEMTPEQASQAQQLQQGQAAGEQGQVEDQRAGEAHQLVMAQGAKELAAPPESKSRPKSKAKSVRR